MTETSEFTARIELHSIVAAKSYVTSAEVEGETILYDEQNQSLHVLDPLATVVWNLLDGSTTLGELCADLAEAFDADLERVQPDVLKLVHDLKTKELLATEEDAQPTTFDPVVQDTEPAPAEDATKAPRFQKIPRTGCQASLDQSTDWAPTDTYRSGYWDVGVRSSTLDVAELLRAALPRHYRPELDGAPPNFSLSVQGEHLDGGVHILYERCTIVDRERSLGQLLVRLLRRLDSLEWQRGDNIVIACSAVADNEGRVVIGPQRLRRELLVHQSMLADDGLTLLDEYVVVDPSGPRVIIPGLTLDVDPVALAHWGVDAQQLRSARRYDLCGWFVHQYANDELTPGHAVALAMGQVRNADELSPDMLLSVVTDLFSQTGRGGTTGDWREFVESARQTLRA